MERRQAEVVVQVVAEIEIAELCAADQQQQWFERTVGLAHRASNRERGFGIAIGANDGARPSGIGLGSTGHVFVGDGFPLPAGEIECLRELRYRRIGKDQQRLVHRSPHREISVQFELRDDSLIVAPFGSFVTEEPFVDVATERLANESGSIHFIDRL